jgi:alpha-L-rhamnosidase
MISPQPGGDLSHASAEYTSLWGTISSAWRIEEGVFILNVTLPANLTATVKLPTSAATAITENGVPLNTTADVRVLAHVPEATGIAFEIGSGTYEFRCPLG